MLTNIEHHYKQIAVDYELRNMTIKLDNHLHSKTLLCSHIQSSLRVTSVVVNLVSNHLRYCSKSRVT